jgi:dTDP-4-dehydrorhamnose reductase
MVRVLITGATGLLGGYLVKEVERRGQVALAYGGPSRERGIDLTDRAAVLTLFEREKPHVVVHSAALAAIGDCAADPPRAERTNVDATQNIATACTKHGVRLVHVSSDLVFDGERPPYKEDATPTPLSLYGRTKAASEIAALSEPSAAVVRVALLFGPTVTARRGFFDQQKSTLEKG